MRRGAWFAAPAGFFSSPFWPVQAFFWRTAKTCQQPASKMIEGCRTPDLAFNDVAERGNAA
jgi:hypothetical protein